jgi:AraC-like DNA-binding protein
LLDRLGVAVDPLSEVLTLLGVHVAEPSRLEAGGNWSLQFQGYQHIKVGAVLAGECWITSEGSDPLFLQQGDCYLLASGRPFGAASDLQTRPVDGHAVFARVWPDTVRHNVADDDPDRTVIVGGAVHFDDTTATLLLDHLPDTVPIAADSYTARVLRPTLELLGEETSSDAPGSADMREQLTRILFVQALRTLLASQTQPTGWLAALTDAGIGTALASIHREPARRWTVAELASAVGMSRSSFALRFKTLVGLSPLDYLARWRIRSAGRALRSTDRTVSSVATEFGYGSESAFSTAFKRLTGHTPAQYRRLPAPTTDAQATVPLAVGMP